jgi:hypothetical protein
VADALAQHLHHASLADLLLQASQELPACGPIHADLHGFGHGGLGSFEKALQLHQIEAEVAVVVARIPQQPTGTTTHRHSCGGGLVGRFQQVGAPGHGSGDQRFQALLAGIGGHGARESGAFLPV